MDVKALEVDYLTIVGHKFYGPRIGALYVRDLGLPNSAPLHPMLFGGGQERNLRPGTENTPMICGLGQAAELVTLNVTEHAASMKEVRDLFETQLEKAFGTNGVHFNGRSESNQRLPNTSNFSIVGENLQGHRVLKHVKGFVASLGAACHSEQENRWGEVCFHHNFVVNPAHS